MKEKPYLTEEPYAYACSSPSSASLDESILYLVDPWHPKPSKKTHFRTMGESSQELHALKTVFYSEIRMHHKFRNSGKASCGQKQEALVIPLPILEVH